MRRLAVLLAALSGCYGYGNPYDTSSEQSEYGEMTERSLEMRLITPVDYPQSGQKAFTDPDLEGWRDTVLATASGDTLWRLREECRHKIAWVEAQCGGLLRQDEHNREPHFTARAWQLRTERIRLRMIEERISSGAPCRTE